MLKQIFDLTCCGNFNGWRRSGGIGTFRGCNALTALVPYEALFAEASGDAKFDTSFLPINQSVDRIARVRTGCSTVGVEFVGTTC